MFGAKGFGFGGAVANTTAPDPKKAEVGIDSTSAFASVGGSYKTYSMRLKEAKDMAGKKT